MIHRKYFFDTVRESLFGGSLAPLVAQFSSQRKLQPADVEALKLLLQDYETPKGGKQP